MKHNSESAAMAVPDTRRERGEAMERLTKEQAAVIGAFTGFLSGPFSDLQEYAEKKFGRPVWTHEFGSREFSSQLKELAREDFISICSQEAQ